MAGLSSLQKYSLARLATMKITMTGALGRIGKVTTQLLVDRGHEVVAVDIADGPVPAGVKLHVGDLTDLDFADKVVAGSDAVIHMAGIPSPRDERQYNVYKNNVNSTFAIFSAAANAKCRVVAYASSCSAYGQAWSDEWTSPLYAPMTEPHPLMCTESYSLCKEANEQAALMWSKRSDTTFVGFRFPYTNNMDELEDFAIKFNHHDAELAKTAAKIGWGYLDARDAAAALELTVRSDLKGAQVFNLMAPDTMAIETTDKLLAKYHPTTELRGDFSGYQSIFSSDHWLEVMGYKPQHLFDREKIRNAK